MKYRRKIIYGCIAAAMSLLLSACGAGQSTITEERFVLDTLITVKVADTGRFSKKQGRHVVDAAFDWAKAVERRLDTHHANSETGRLNKDAGGPTVQVSNDMWTALTIGKTVNRQTSGAFDLTIGPVIELWGFGDKPRVPDPDRLRAVLKLVGADGLTLEPGSFQWAGLARQGMSLDLGAVGKGVAVDRMAEALHGLDLDNSLINTVSSIRAVGPKPDGSPWRVGVQSPRPKTTPGMIAVIELTKGSISTSGDYQRFFTVDGRRYHHIIDPKTGRPAQGFMSVTVVTDKSAAYADALSTGLAVMGRESAMKLVEKLPGVEALFIDQKGRFWISDGLKGKLRKIRPKIN